MAIEAALGHRYHIAARGLRKVPEGYAECFAVLRDAGFIPQDLSERLRQMARFRNLLIHMYWHMYWKVDYGRVYDVIQQSLPDLRAFAAAAGLL